MAVLAHEGPSGQAEGPSITLLKWQLARMLALVIGLRLRHVARGVLHELGHGFLAPEAIGLALNLRVDGAVRSNVFAERPSVHMLLNSPVTARAAVVRPSNSAPAKADVM